MGVAVKTGLADRVRQWAREINKPFTSRQICDAFGLSKKPECHRLWNTLSDFLKRGEIERIGAGVKFRYNHSRAKSRKSPLRAKILKGMYVSISSFSASDIQRLSGAKNKGYVLRVAQSLAASGDLKKIGRKTNALGNTEILFRVSLRDEFFLKHLKG